MKPRFVTTVGERSIPSPTPAHITYSRPEATRYSYIVRLLKPKKK